MKCRQQARTSVFVHCIHAGHCHCCRECTHPRHLLHSTPTSLSSLSLHNLSLPLFTPHSLSPLTLHSSPSVLISHPHPSSLTLIPHHHPHPSPSPSPHSLLIPPCTAVLPSLTMRCSRIDLLVLDGSGLLLHDGTVLAIEGKPLRIGCYCGSVHQLPYRRT